jgi:predicted enzyme related to lactoylglutathione lyase
MKETRDVIDGVSQVSLNVSVGDQDQALAFWTEAIGFELLSDETVGDERWIRVSPPDHGVTLVLGGPNPWLREFHRNYPAQLPQSPVFFSCRDIQETHRQLTARGVTFVQPPTQMFFGWWALFCDPDGNRFALNQRPD